MFIIIQYTSSAGLSVLALHHEYDYEAVNPNTLWSQSVRSHCINTVLTLQFQKPEDIFTSIDATPDKKSVESIYQRKTQLEHILLRPDTYVGSVEETTEPMYVFDEEKQAIIKRPVTFVPGLYKIFDEILGEQRRE